MRSISILVYLNAGGIKGKSSLAKLQAACNSKNIEYKIYISEYPKHTKKLIKNIVDKTKNLKNHRIVVLGGDGTINEAVHGLIEADYNYPISYFPSGTGNDFAKSMNITLDENKFLDELFFVSKEDIEVIYSKNNLDNSTFIALNGIGIGFDAIVSHLNNINKNAKKKKAKKISYLSKILSAYKKSSPFSAKILVDDKYRYEFDNILFLSFMNNCYYGGGIKIDPYAYKNNNKIGLILVKDVSVKIIPKLLYHVLFTGKQFQNTSNMKRISGKKFEVEVNDTRHIQADGEVTILNSVDMTMNITNYPFYLVEK